MLAAARAPGTALRGEGGLQTDPLKQRGGREGHRGVDGGPPVSEQDVPGEGASGGGHAEARARGLRVATYLV